MDKIKQARRWCNQTVIVSIEFRTNRSNGECDLTLDLATDEKAGSDAISIRFIGVSNLKIDEIGGGISQLISLKVVDIRKQQWDRLNYKVCDYETQRIEFLCRDFYIEREYKV